jgi:transposase
MIAPGPSIRVFLALGASDMRKGLDGLFGLVHSKLQEDPFSGHLFANASRNRLKVFYWDGSGLLVCSKRLERGRYRWPDAAGRDCKVELSAAELTLLLSVIDLDKTRRRQRWRGHAAA